MMSLIVGKSKLFTFVFKCHKSVRYTSILDELFFKRDICWVRNYKTTATLTNSNRRNPSQAPFKTMAESSPIVNLKPQQFDFFLILDFEATCIEDKQIRPQEIIEFPCLKINAKTLQIESTFHQYVLPKVNPDLSPFCTQLTGIIQSMVDGKPPLEEVLKSFDKWMLEENLLDPNVKSLFITCGDWDLIKMLPSQCEYFNIPIPTYFNTWLNIKKAFASVTQSYPKGMMPMLHKLNIPHQGRHHSGIDDCKNIGNIFCELLKKGYVANASGTRQ